MFLSIYTQRDRKNMNILEPCANLCCMIKKVQLTCPAKQKKWSSEWIRKYYSLPLFEILHWLTFANRINPHGILAWPIRPARGESCLLFNHIWQLSPPSPICSSPSGHPFLPWAKFFSTHSVLHMLPGIPMTTPTSRGWLLFLDIFTLNVPPWGDFPWLPTQWEIPSHFLCQSPISFFLAYMIVFNYFMWVFFAKTPRKTTSGTHLPYSSVLSPVTPSVPDPLGGLNE